MATVITQPTKTKAVYVWWSQAHEVDRMRVSVDAGYSTEHGKMKAISLNRFEVEAFAIELKRRGLIDFEAERTSWYV